MKDEGKKLAKQIKIEDVGEPKEFVGCKININKMEKISKIYSTCNDSVIFGRIWCRKKEASYTSRTKQFEKGKNLMRF